ncbi:hypothetical protein ACIB24_21255 [Spongisporangium articulatum]|uniref:DUF8094 domain-containing protein n=1 Tax=Spongisporangium articulatum TaxID=3362603 RepID=A0ABW8AT80_9ACTN
MRRRFVAVAAAAALVALAGCSADGHVVDDETPLETAAHPVVGLSQAATVLSAVDAGLVRNRGVTTVKKADDRVIGPYRDIALADNRVAAKLKRKAPSAGTFTPVRLLVPLGAGWPRYFVAVGEVSGESTPSLRVLRSTSARDPYGLWAQASMLPGATLPQVASPSTGATALPADATSGLAMSPAKALSGYAAYLNSRGGTAGFKRSSYSDQVIGGYVSTRKRLSKVATVTSRHRAMSGAPVAIRTTDGGAVVIGELEQTYTLKTKNNRAVQLTDKQLQALAGGKKAFGKTFTRTSVEVIVLYVPRSGDVTVVAAQKGDVKAVAK